MMGILPTIERWYHILRAVPVMQLARRLQILVWRGLEPRYLPTPPSSKPEWRDELPKPLFPPRIEQWRQDGDQAFLDLAWGSRELTLPMAWVPPLNSRLDGSWRARLQYMEYLEGADDHWFAALIEDWLEQVKLDDRDMRLFGWRAFNLSIRAVVWMQQVGRRRDRLPPELIERMGQSLSHQMIYLERFLETDLRGNHLIKNLKAFLWAGRCFEGDLAKHWGDLGKRLLIQELSEQLLSDGTHCERSPAYHCQVLADLIECHQVLETGPLADQLGDAIQQMAGSLQWLVHPDGQIAQFNDGGLTMAYTPEQCLKAAGTDRAPLDGPFALAAAGFYGHRSGGDYLIVDCGRLAPDYLIGHGHGDILSFEWSVHGHRIIVDQGTFQNLGGERRQISRATVSHNTVSIDGLDQGDFYGAHRCGRRPTPELIRFEPKPGGFELEGRHNGFGHLAGGPSHYRRFDLLPQRLVLEDRIESLRDHAGQGGFLLHPGCEVEFDGAGLNIRYREVCIRLTANCPLELRDAEWYPDLYCALPTKRIVYDVQKSKPAHMTFERLDKVSFIQN